MPGFVSYERLIPSSWEPSLGPLLTMLKFITVLVDIKAAWRITKWKSSRNLYGASGFRPLQASCGLRSRSVCFYSAFLSRKYLSGLCKGLWYFWCCLTWFLLCVGSSNVSLLMLLGIPESPVNVFLVTRNWASYSSKLVSTCFNTHQPSETAWININSVQVISVIADVCFAFCPIIILWKVQIKPKTKIGLCFLMGFGVMYDHFTSQIFSLR